MRRRSRTCSWNNQCLATSFCLFAVLVRQLVQQACRAHSLTHMSGDSWATPCRVITYTGHTFQHLAVWSPILNTPFNTLLCDHLYWTHLSNTPASVSWRKLPLCHISENMVLTKKKWRKNADTRRLLHLQHLYPRKYTGHVYTQHLSAKIFTLSSTGTFKKLTKQTNETGNIHGLLPIKINECPLLFYLRIEHYQLLWIIVNQYRFSSMKIDTGLTQVISMWYWRLCRYFVL